MMMMTAETVSERRNGEEEGRGEGGNPESKHAKKERTLRRKSERKLYIRIENEFSYVYEALQFRVASKQILECLIWWTISRTTAGEGSIRPTGLAPVSESYSTTTKREKEKKRREEEGREGPTPFLLCGSSFIVREGRSVTRLPLQLHINGAEECQILGQV